MTEVERRRRTWHALGLGPLWLPVAGRLPGAPVSDTPRSVDDAAQAAGDAHPDAAAASAAAHGSADRPPDTASAITAGLAPDTRPTAESPALVAARSPHAPPSPTQPLNDGDPPVADHAVAARGAPPVVPDASPPDDGPPEARMARPMQETASLPARRTPPQTLAPPPADGLAASLGAALGVPLTPAHAPAAHAAARAPMSSATSTRTARVAAAPPAAPGTTSAAHDRGDARPASAVPPHPDEDPSMPAGEWLAPWTVDDGWVAEPMTAVFEEPPGFWDDPGMPAAVSEPAQAPLEAAATAPRVPAPSIPQRWQALREAVAGCQRCPLAQTRQNVVFGRGRPEQARWLLIGEAPGAEEDRQGEAFVGQAGRLLDAMLQATGIDPEADVFIANVLKCRPPGNRNPEADEVARCEGFLHEQIRLTQPDCILLLGRFAAQSVLQSELPIGRLRNKVHHIMLDERRIPVVVTYHPAYLLRNPLDKLKSWEDLCLARTAIDKADEPPQPLSGHRPPR